MEKKLILGGGIAGAVAGLFAFIFARIFAEPLIQRAIDYESGRDAAQSALDKAAGIPVEPEGPEIFTRTVQANIGIGIGMVGFGLAMGLLVAVTYTILMGRTGRLRARSLALLVPAAGFVVIYLVPFAKYPANPPAIGHEETIGDRSGLYVIMLVASVVLAIAAVFVGQKLAARFGNFAAVVAAGLGFLVLIGIVMAVLPNLGELSANVATYGQQSSETPLPLRNPSGDIVFPGFPADVLAQFRVYSIAAQLILWTVLGLIFSPIAGRIVDGKKPAGRKADAVPVA